MDWDDVRFFLALARAGSVRGAGAAVGVSHTTVLRRVEALEERLGTRLFDRHRDGWLLTDAGHEMVPRAERVEREIAALERDLAGQDERYAGTVSITCFDPWVSDLLVRDLAAFCAEYPEIELNLANDARSFDLSKREADIAVRILVKGALPPEHLIGTRLAPVVIANYVAVAHAERLDPEQVGTATRWLATGPERVQAELVATSSYPDVTFWGRFSSVELLLQGALHGLGLVMLPTYMADTEPGLRRLAKADLRHVADLWLLSHPDLRANTRLRAVRERILRVFEAHADRFTGD